MKELNPQQLKKCLRFIFLGVKKKKSKTQQSTYCVNIGKLVLFVFIINSQNSTACHKFQHKIDNKPQVLCSPYSSHLTFYTQQAVAVKTLKIMRMLHNSNATTFNLNGGKRLVFHPVFFFLTKPAINLTHSVCCYWNDKNLFTALKHTELGSHYFISRCHISLCVDDSCPAEVS